MPVTTLLSIGELALLCLGAVVLFRRSRHTVSQSICSGICVAMMFLSFVFQAAFLMRMPRLAFPLEIAALGIAGWLVMSGASLKDLWCALTDFVRTRRVMALLLFATWAYLGLQAVLLPPGNEDSMAYNLARVLLFEREHTVFLDNVTTVRQVMFPLGADILTHLFLRFGTDYGVSLFSFISYIAIITGTYGLARRHTERKYALTAAIIVAGLPELVYQATSTKNDIVAAAVGVFCLMIADELWEKPELSRAVLLMLALCFGISTKITFAALAVPFMVVFGLGLLGKYGLRAWRADSAHRWHALVASAPLLVLSQAWLFINNKLHWDGWTAPPELQMITRQLDGISGGIANILRYLLQSFDLTPPVDHVFRVARGFGLSEIGDRIYMSFVHPVFRDAGLATCCGTFRMRWETHEDFAWFGPLGFFFIIPAIVYASLRAHGFLRVVAISLLGFLLITSFTVGWTPYNNRYFSVLFGLSGALVAFLLQRVKPGRLSMQGVTAVSMFLLVYAAVYNTEKPLLTTHVLWKAPAQLAKTRIWASTSWGRDRLYYARMHYQDDRLVRFHQLVPAGARVAMVVEDPRLASPWVYQYLLMHPNVNFIPTTPSRLTTLNADYSLLLDPELPRLAAGKGEVVWDPQPNHRSRFEGLLLRLTGSP